MKRILVPCDFTPPSVEAFRFSISLAEKSGAEIHVLNVLDMTFTRGTPNLGNSYAFNLKFVKDYEQEVNDDFRKMWEQYAPLTMPIKFRHTIGSLVPDIENYTTEHEIDLIVMGTHGKANGKWGSNTEKVVRTSPVPVIAVRKAPTREIKNIVMPVVPEQRDAQFIDRIKELQKFFSATLHLIWINTPLIFKTDQEARQAIERYAESAGLEQVTVNFRSDYFVEQGVFRFAREISADMVAVGTHGRKGLLHFFTGSIAEDIVNHLDIPVWTCTLKDRSH